MRTLIAEAALALALLSTGISAFAAERVEVKPTRLETGAIDAPTVVAATATSYPWAAPNKLTVGATLDKIKAEDGPGWLAAIGAPSTAVSRRVALHQAHLDRGLAKSILFHVETPRKIIALTFDDGPHAGWTTKLLATLKDCDVPATFFVVGKQVEKFPELARDIDAAGFTIGNHTYDHVSLLKIPGQYVPTELLACASAVKTVVGSTPRYFRPPGGELDKDVVATAEELGYQTVLWTDDPGDFASPPADVILKRTLAHASPGGIILLHDGIPGTLEALPKIVEQLKAQGYEFVDLDELRHERDLAGRPSAAVVRTVSTTTLPIPVKPRYELRKAKDLPLKALPAVNIVH